tara:strand:+ start:355 stop:1020 length:666 start_codon:yes stop_codon:yes gene_type:complete
LPDCISVERLSTLRDDVHAIPREEQAAADMARRVRVVDNVPKLSASHRVTCLTVFFELLGVFGLVNAPPSFVGVRGMKAHLDLFWSLSPDLLRFGGEDGDAVDLLCWCEPLDTFVALQVGTRSFTWGVCLQKCIETWLFPPMKSSLCCLCLFGWGCPLGKKFGRLEAKTWKEGVMAGVYDVSLLRMLFAVVSAVGCARSVLWDGDTHRTNASVLEAVVEAT